MMSRCFIQRSCLLLGFIALSAYLFYIGKGHMLLVDTNMISISGQEFRSAEMIEVSIDGKEPESMGRAERIMVNVGGPRHTITIEVVSGDERKIEKQFTVPTFMDTAVISIPAILGNAPPENWVTHFTPPPMEDTPAEQMLFEQDAPAAPVAPEAPLKP
jgi:hypothetical protein